jgi:hypothetical protein
MKNIFSNFLLSKVEKKVFINIFFITFFAMSSLLLANILYTDDPTRVTTGETFWINNGRPLSSLISLLLQLGTPLIDISPFPQVLAFAIYSLSAVYLGKLFEVKDSLFLTLSGIIFVLNPFNLENFAFVFDSFPMAVAVLTSTLAALIISNYFSRKEKIIDFGLSLILLICSLCLYQTATSIYLVTCFFYALFKLLNRQTLESFKIFLASITVLLISFLAYIPLKTLYPLNEYSLQHSQLISISEFPQNFIRNLLSFWANIQRLLGHGIILNLLYILLIAIIFSIASKAINLFKKDLIIDEGDAIASPSNSNYLSQYLFVTSSIIFFILLLLLAVPGAMLVLKNPIFEPRTATGLSALIAISCLLLSKLFSSKKQNFFKYCLISFLFLLSLVFANVSFAFGNVLYNQNVQDEIIITMLVSDLGKIMPKLSASQPNISVAVVNTLDYTYGNIKTYEKYPILQNMTWYFLHPQIQFYTKLETLGFKFNRPNYRKNIFTGPNNQFVPKTKAILNSSLYKIYFENNESLVIVFQNPHN